MQQLNLVMRRQDLLIKEPFTAFKNLRLLLISQVRRKINTDELLNGEDSILLVVSG